MERLKNLAKVIFGIPITLVAFFFIAKVFFESWGGIKESLVKADPVLILSGVFLMLIFFLLRSFAWGKVLSMFGATDKDTFESIYLYSLAETKRYIPGNIFSFISRVQKFRTESYSNRTIIHGIVLEAFFSTTAAFIVSLPILINLFERTNVSPWLLLIVPLVILGLVIFTNNKKKVLPRAKISQYLDTILIYTAAWACFGVANYLLCVSIFPTSPELIIIFSSIFSLSWLLGYISFVTPMGLGAREAAVIYFLSPFFPIFAATAISVFTRLLMVLSEIIFLVVSFLLHKYLRHIRKYITPAPTFIVAFFVFLYVSYFSFFTIVRHFNFFSGKFDLGNMENTLWNTVNGNVFIFSNPDGMGEISRLSAHSDFILLLIAPAYAVFQSANVLLLVQTVTIGAGGFFVYLISKKVLSSEKLSVLLCAGYLLNYFIQEQNIFDFHSVSLATSLLLGAFYFLINFKYKLFSLFLFLAVLTKENVFLIASLFGVFLFFSGRKVTGSMLSVFSLLIFLFLMIYAIPNSRGGDHFAIEYLSYLGNSPLEIILSPVLKPATFFSALFNYETLKYLYITLLPAGFLSILSPAYLIFAFPDFLINTLSDNPNLRSIQYHYGALTAPFVYISAIYGIKNLSTFLKNKERTFAVVFYYLLVIIVVSTYYYSPLPGLRYGDTSAFQKIENSEQIHEKIIAIPSEASVSATNNVAAHLVKREKIYIIPNGIETSDYLVFYKNNLDLAGELMTNVSEFAVVENLYDFIILKRVNFPDKSYTP